jgi:fibronectin type 3 domain-containing protein
MLDAWLATGMAAPAVMTSATWGSAPPDPGCNVSAPVLDSATGGTNSVALQWSPVENATSYGIFYDQSDKSQPHDSADCAGPGDCTYTDAGLDQGQSYCYKITAVGESCESDFSNILCATTQPAGQTGAAGTSALTTGSIVTTGKGKNQQQTYEQSTTFSAGEDVVIRMTVTDEAGSPVSDATVTLLVDGPSTATLTTSVSDGTGFAEATWPTSAPNKKGNGGTPTGSYTITVNGLSSATHDWDMQATSVSIDLQ